LRAGATELDAGEKPPAAPAAAEEAVVAPSDVGIDVDLDAVS
jgi:hypothetical protein